MMNQAFEYGARMGGQRMMDGAGFGFGGFGILAFLGFLFVAALVGLVSWAIVRKPSGSHAAPQIPSADDTALAIARERLARGEIEPDQYAAIAAALRNQPLPTTP